MQSRPRASQHRPNSHPAWNAALIYGGLSLGGAVAFFVVTTFAGDYPAVARYGGAAWVFLLLMIVLMPIVIPRVQKRGRGKPGPPGVIPVDTEVVCPIEPVSCPVEEPQMEAPPGT